MLVVLASSNRGKVSELKRLLPEWVEVKTADDVCAELPEETGLTFLENALLKARAVTQQANVVAVADDSGLEVDAIDGAPGVRSARFAGDQANDEANNALLLRRLDGVAPPSRTARFRSVVAVTAPDGTEFYDEGSIEGEILTFPQGNGGFGYDPLFRPLDRERTFAELSLDEKNKISHRGIAFRNISARLITYLQSIETNGTTGAGGSDRTSR